MGILPDLLQVVKFRVFAEVKFTIQVAPVAPHPLDCFLEFWYI